jgi:hypothetical protein
MLGCHGGGAHPPEGRGEVCGGAWEEWEWDPGRTKAGSKEQKLTGSSDSGCYYSFQPEPCSYPQVDSYIVASR